MFRLATSTSFREGVVGMLLHSTSSPDIFAKIRAATAVARNACLYLLITRGFVANSVGGVFCRFSGMLQLRLTGHDIVGAHLDRTGHRRGRATRRRIARGGTARRTESGLRAHAAQIIASGICGRLVGAGHSGAYLGVRLGPYRGVSYHRDVLVLPAYGYPRRLGGGLAAQPRVGPEEIVVRMHTMAGQPPPSRRSRSGPGAMLNPLAVLVQSTISPFSRSQALLLPCVRTVGSRTFSWWEYVLVQSGRSKPPDLLRV